MVAYNVFVCILSMVAYWLHDELDCVLERLYPQGKKAIKKRYEEGCNIFALVTSLRIDQERVETLRS